jgi:DNA-binding SARP family transcriptional activator
VDQLRLWFKLLPEEIVAGNGYLLYIKSFINYQKDVDDALQLLEGALALFQQAKDAAMQFYTLIAMAHLKIQRNDVLGLKKIHSQVAVLSESFSDQPYKDMSLVFDFTIAIWEEKLSRGASLFRSVQSLPVTDEWQWLELVYSSQMYYLLGEINLAERQIREALELDMVKRAELLRGYTKLVYSVILQVKDEQDEQPWVMEEIMAIAEKHDYKFLLGFGRRLGAFACYRRHNLEQALDMLDTSTCFFEELANATMASSNRLYRGLWLCRLRNPGEVLIEAEEALQALTAVPSGQCLQEIGLSIFGAIAREAGEYELAENNLTAAIKKSKAKGAKLITAGSCLHLAKLHYDTGHYAAGEECLTQAFNLAADNKYVMFWDMHFPTLVEMVARCVKSRIYTGYALTLITRYYGSEAAEFLRRTVPAALDLKEFADAFLSRYGISEELHIPIIRVDLFGRFNISVNDIIIPKDEWKTKKITGVLKYLLVHRGRAISKDRLMDMFWPGADKKLASMSLRAAQYELKKVFRKYGAEADGETLFLNERRDSLGVRTGKMLVVDVDLFLSHFNELKKLPPDKSDMEQKKTILERMVDLYKGDLLEEELYEDWAFAEREELRSIYFGSVMELVNIYIVDGEQREAEKLLLKTLARDQYNEEACLCLIKLYIAANQKGRAVKLYSKFVSRFERELNIKPDERLSILIKGQS